MVGSAAQRGGQAAGRPVLNPTAMTRHPGLLLGLAGRRFFTSVTLPDGWPAQIRALHQRGTVIHLLPVHSLFDFLFLHWATLEHDLALSMYASEIRPLHGFLFRKLRAAVGVLVTAAAGWRRIPEDELELLRAAVDTRQPGVLFLQRRRSLLQWGGGYRDDALEALIEAARAADAPIFLVPEVITWKVAPPQEEPSLWNLVFRDATPGRVRKLLKVLLNPGTAALSPCEPIDVQAFVAGAEDAGTQGTRALARALRDRLVGEFQIEDKVIHGPVLKRADKIRAEILADPAVQAEAARVAQAEGVDSAKVLAGVESSIRAMAADFRINTIEAMSLLLTFVWNRIYDGVEVDEEGLAQVRQAARRAPLAVVPTHRSHIDYLLISYLFYNRGLIPPHIAAGDNLAFFPLGSIFRRSGAFFIKRASREDSAYPIAFRAYLRKLVAEGYWVEFFPEGGRSRTGKVLPPKVGMLGELVGAIVDGVRDDLLFAPVSIAYEKIIESTSYAQELRGADKQGESVSGVLKATSVLRSRYGKVYLRFDGVVSARAFVEECAARGKPEDALHPLQLKRFGYRLLAGMNRAAVVTPTGIVCLILLAQPRAGIARARLGQRAGAIVAYLRRKGARFSGSLAGAIATVAERLDNPPPDAAALPAVPGELGWGRDRYEAQLLAPVLRPIIEEAVGLFASEDAVIARDYGDEPVYEPSAKHRVALDFYKNNLIHHLIPEAILATALLEPGATEAGACALSAIRDRCFFTSRLFRREFVYDPDLPFDAQFRSVLGRMAVHGWVELHAADEDGPERVTVPPRARERLGFFAAVLAPFVEGYWMALGQLRTLQPAPMKERDWTKAARRSADKGAARGEVLYREAATTVMFQNALEIFIELGVVTRSDAPAGGRRGRPERLLSLSADNLAALTGMLPLVERALPSARGEGRTP